MVEVAEDDEGTEENREEVESGRMDTVGGAEKCNMDKEMDTGR